MMRTFALWSVALVLSFQGVSAARAQSLGVGDSAPKLEVKEFVKGDAVKEFEKGKTYVVEFWATWCGRKTVVVPSPRAILVASTRHVFMIYDTI